MLTIYFIFIAFGLIVIYDIIAVIIQNKKLGIKLGWKTITSVFRRWYDSRPLVAFMTSGIFIGHFYLYQFNKIFSVNISLWIFISLSVLFMIWQIIEMIRKEKSKIFKIMCGKMAFIPIVLGALIGSFWR